jgi:Metallo-peptidase family M12
LSQVVAADVPAAAVAAAFTGIVTPAAHVSELAVPFTEQASSALFKLAAARSATGRVSFLNISVERLAQIRPADVSAGAADAFGVSERMICFAKTNRSCVQFNPQRITHYGTTGVFVSGTVTSQSRVRSPAWFNASPDGAITGYVASSVSPVRILKAAGDASQAMVVAIPLPTTAAAERYPADVRGGPAMSNPTSSQVNPVPIVLNCENPTDSPQIDLVVIYTARAAAQSHAAGLDIRDQINVALILANQTLQNANVAGTLRILDVSQTQATEGDANDYTWFDSILNDIDRPQPTTWREIVDKKNGMGAAIGLLIVDANNERACGLSDGYRVDSRHAFSVVNWHCLEGRYSFVHEIGHLMGLWHDPATRAREGVPDSDVSPTYAQGYITQGTNKVVSIMGYVDSCLPNCGRIGAWTDPARKDPFYGATFGDAQLSAETCVWRQRFDEVAKFGRGANHP